MENKQKFAKLKQYVQLAYLVVIAITIVFFILGNNLAGKIFIVIMVAYIASAIFMREIPEPEDESFNVKINFITKCIQYPSYVLLAILMFKTWMERG